MQSSVPHARTPALLPAQEAGPTLPCIVSRLLLTTGTRVPILLPGGGSLAGTEFQMQPKINILRLCGLSHRSLVAVNAPQLALPTGLLSMQLRCKITPLKSSPPGLFASSFKALVD